MMILPVCLAVYLSDNAINGRNVINFLPLNKDKRKAESKKCSIYDILRQVDR